MAEVEYSEPLFDPIKKFKEYKEGRLDIHKKGIEQWVDRIKADKGYQFTDDSGNKKIHEGELKSEHIDSLIGLYAEYEALGAKYSELGRELKDTSPRSIKNEDHEGLAEYLFSIAKKVGSYDLMGFDPEEESFADDFYGKFLNMGKALGADIREFWQKAQRNDEEGKRIRGELSNLILKHTELQLKSSLFDNAIRELDPQDIDTVNSYKLAVATFTQYLSSGKYYPDVTQWQTLEETNKNLSDLVRKYSELEDLPHKKEPTRTGHHRVNKTSLEDEAEE